MYIYIYKQEIFLAANEENCGKDYKTISGITKRVSRLPNHSLKTVAKIIK